jgi:hypothetical protein
MRKKSELGFGLAFKHLASAVKTGWADVVAKMRLTGGGLYSNARYGKGIVRAVHAALGRRFFILLDGHDPLLSKGAAKNRVTLGLVKGATVLTRSLRL